MTGPVDLATPTGRAWPTLTPEQTETVRAMCDWFVPPTVDAFPNWQVADPDESVLVLALEQLAPHREQLTAALDACADADAAKYLERVRVDDPPLFTLLFVLCMGRYLACRPVWQVMGYPGQRPTPVRPGEAEEYLADGLLDQPIARGKVFRATPGLD